MKQGEENHYEHFVKECDSGKVSEIDDSIGEDGDSLLNPATPRCGADGNIIEVPDHISPSMNRQVLNDQILSTVSTEVDNPQSSDLDGEVFDTANWKPRDQESSLSMLNNISDNEKESSGVDNDVNTELDDCILKDLDKLIVQKRRGRPRKNNSKLVNKHFKLPRRKKLKGEGLQQMSHFFLNNNVDEAEAIFETGVLMGLIPFHTKEKSMALIKGQLR